MEDYEWMPKGQKVVLETREGDSYRGVVDNESKVCEEGEPVSQMVELESYDGVFTYNPEEAFQPTDVVSWEAVEDELQQTEKPISSD